MKKKNFVSMIIMAALCVAVACPVFMPTSAQAQAVVSLDIPFANPEGTAFVTTNDLSNAAGQELSFIKCWGVTPADTALNVYLRHKDAGGTWRETALPTLTLAGGVISTNLVNFAAPLIGAKGDKYRIVFSTGTNGFIQVLGKIYR